MFFFSSRRRHTRYIGDWSSDVCSSDLHEHAALHERRQRRAPGHYLGRIRANREQPQPRRVREWRLDEVDAEALIVRTRKTMADLAFGATAMDPSFAIGYPPCAGRFLAA